MFIDRNNDTTPTPVSDGFLANIVRAKADDALAKYAIGCAAIGVRLVAREGATDIHGRAVDSHVSLYFERPLSLAEIGAFWSAVRESEEGGDHG
jgi:hypothetical protein